MKNDQDYELEAVYVVQYFNICNIFWPVELRIE